MPGNDDAAESPPSKAIEGLNVLRLYGQRTVREWFPDPTQPEGSRRQQPAATDLEAVVAMSQIMHPQTACIRRADASREFVQAHRLPYEDYQPIGVPYNWDGGEHTYWVDWLVYRVGLPHLLLEAGRWDIKDRPLGRAKAAAARAWAAERGWDYGIATDAHFPLTYRFNLRELVAALAGAPADPAMATDLRAVWTESRGTRISTAIKRAGGDTRDPEWFGSAMRLVAEAYKAGKVLIDLRETRLNLETVIHLAPEDLPPITAESFPSDLEGARRPDAPEIDEDLAPLLAEDGNHRPTVDPETLPPDQRDRFRILTEAMEMWDLGTPVTRIAAAVSEAGLKIGRPGLYYLRERYLDPDLGPAALVDRATYPDLGSGMDERYQDEVRRLYTGGDRPEWTKIRRKLQTVQEKLRIETGKVVPRPEIGAIERFCHQVLDRELEVRQARSGELHPPPARATRGFLATVRKPGQILQLDAWRVDLAIVAEDGSDVTLRCQCLALIDVYERVPVAVMLSPTDLATEDIVRLIQLAMQDKTPLARSMGCENAWDVRCKPIAIVTDNASIARNDALAEALGRLAIHVMYAPRFDGPFKGIVEGWFAEIAKLFVHNFDSTSLSNPTRRGAHDADGAAIRAKITFEEFRSLFFRFVVDHYLQRPTKGSLNRYLAWMEAAAKYGVHQFRGTSDDLKVYLMRRVNPKREDGLYGIHGAGLSLFNAWYRPVEGIVEDYRPGDVEYWLDRWDLTFIYPRVVTSPGVGHFLGPWMTDAYGGARIGYDEWEALKAKDRPTRLAAEAAAEGSLLRVLAIARLPRAERKKVAQAYLKMKYRDEFIPQIHPEAALVARARLFAGDVPAGLTNGPSRTIPSEPLSHDPMVESPFVWGTEAIEWRSQ
jgi:hypothetical protein